MSIEQKTFNTPNEHQVHLLTVDTLTKEKKCLLQVDDVQ